MHTEISCPFIGRAKRSGGKSRPTIIINFRIAFIFLTFPHGTDYTPNVSLYREIVLLQYDTMFNLLFAAYSSILSIKLILSKLIYSTHKNYKIYFMYHFLRKECFSSFLMTIISSKIRQRQYFRFNWKRLFSDVTIKEIKTYWSGNARVFSLCLSPFSLSFVLLYAKHMGPYRWRVSHPPFST